MRALLLVAVCAARLAAADAPPPIAVVPALLREDGVVTYDGDRPSGQPTTLSLSLAVRVAGPGAVLEIGAARIVSLTVDDGRAIAIPADRGDQQFPWRDAGLGWPAGARRPQPRALLVLPPDAHSAKRIAKLVGSLPCTWAESRKRVTLAPLAPHLGKRIRVAGIDGEPIVGFTRDGDVVSAALEPAVARALAEVAFTNADGSDVAAQIGQTQSGLGDIAWTWTIAGAPGDVALRLDWWSGIRHADVEFTITDLALADAGKAADDF